MITYHVLQAAADLAKQLNAIDEFDVEYGTFHIATTIELKFDGEPTGYQLVNYDPEGWTLEALPEEADASAPERWQIWYKAADGEHQSYDVRGTYPSEAEAQRALESQQDRDGSLADTIFKHYVKKIS